MKKIILPLLIALLIHANSGADHAHAKNKPLGSSIVKEWDERPAGKDLATKATFTLINSRGQKRIRKTRRYWIDMEGKNGFNEKTIIFFDKPSDVKGTSLLNWSYSKINKDDDQWLYLPALRKIKRMASADKEKSFMGSDLTYDDMGDRDVEEDEHRLTGTEDINGNSCYIIEMIPLDRNYMYSKKIVWIDREEYIDYRIDFYDRKGRFLKRQENTWTKVADIWVLKKISVKNEQSGHSTVVEMQEININTGLKENRFTKRIMESDR